MLPNFIRISTSVYVLHGKWWGIYSHPPFSFFSGHDHDLQHIKENGSDVHYFVSGAGHLIDSSKNHAVSLHNKP